MEEIAAAKAMGWNVELDRGLRASKPGSSLEAILKLGPRLQRWSQELPVSAITSSLFKLDLGQDRAFANAILMRLVDAFQNGNNITKFCILKVFLFEMRNRRHFKYSGKGNCKSLLTKERIPNYLEMLKRVRMVMNSGDMVARALALRVIGCLANIAWDSSGIHCIVFEALHSPFQQEQSAALFAMGCLCEISESFAFLALEKLIMMVDAIETVPESRIKAIRVFSLMSISTAVALQAHEAGKDLMLKFPTDEVVATMLVALSRLAYKSIITLHDQVDLLFSYLSSDPRAIVRAVSLKCLIKLADSAIKFTPFQDRGFQLLLSMLENFNIPFGLQQLAFQALRKLSFHYATVVDVESLQKLLTLVELHVLRPNWLRAQPALNLLVDLVCHIEEMRGDIWKPTDILMGIDDGEQGMESLAGSPGDKYPVGRDFVMRICWLLCDHVALAASQGYCIDLKQKIPRRSLMQWSDDKGAPACSERCQFTCGLLLQLVEKCPQTGFVAIDCIGGMVEALLEKAQKISHSSQCEVTQENISMGNVEMQGTIDTCPTSNQTESRESKPLEPESCNSQSFRLWLLRKLCQCLRGGLSIIESKEELFQRAICRLDQLVSFVTTSYLPCNIMRALLPVLLKISGYMSPEERSRVALKIGYMAESDVGKGEFWAAYKFSLQAAFHGLWRESALVLCDMANRVQSEGCYFWLRALALLSNSESNIQIEAQKLHTICFKINCGTLEFQNMDFGSYNGIDLKLREAATKALPDLHCATNSLAAAVNLDRAFEFQRWLLSLRTSQLECITELLGLLGPICHDLRDSDIQLLSSEVVSSGASSPWETADDVYTKQLISSVQALVNKADLFSSRLNKLAIEFDMLSASFIGMDIESLRILSSAALGCSLLAFCTAFAFFFPTVWNNNPQTNSSVCMPFTQLECGSIATDLYQRVDAIGDEDWTELLLFSLQLGQVNTSPFNTKWSSSLSLMEKNLLLVAKWAVKEIFKLQGEAGIRQQEEICRTQARGILVLKEVVDRWLCLPWVLPRYFSCTRPRAGVEIFVRRMDGGDSELTTSQGMIIPLSLCVQVQFLPSNCRVKRLCCALLLNPEDKCQAMIADFYCVWRVGWTSDFGIGKMSHLSLIEELLYALRNKDFALEDREDMAWESRAEAEEQRGNKRNGFNGSVPLQKPIVTCDIDNHGQGFASYLLDTTNLPCGMFRITLQAVCTDGNGHQKMLLPSNIGPTLKILPV